MPPPPLSPASLPRALTQADLRWLACPACHGSLVLQEKVLPSDPSRRENGDVAILCTHCTRTFLLEDGLPVLLTHRAIPAL